MPMAETGTAHEIRLEQPRLSASAPDLRHPPRRVRGRPHTTARPSNSCDAHHYARVGHIHGNRRLRAVHGAGARPVRQRDDGRVRHLGEPATDGGHGRPHHGAGDGSRRRGRDHHGARVFGQRGGDSDGGTGGRGHGEDGRGRAGGVLRRTTAGRSRSAPAGRERSSGSGHRRDLRGDLRRGHGVARHGRYPGRRPGRDDLDAGERRSSDPDRGRRRTDRRLSCHRVAPCPDHRHRFAAPGTRDRVVQRGAEGEGRQYGRLRLEPARGQPATRRARAFARRDDPGGAAGSGHVRLHGAGRRFGRRGSLRRARDAGV